MKKVSRVTQVKEMLANDPALKVEKVMEVCGVKKAYAYTLISNAKKPKAEKRKYTRTTMTKKEGMAVLGKEVLQGRQAIDRLIAENNRLRSLIQEKDNTITALKIDMLDQQAVINYLEKKLIK
jgi:hypothetical protein